MGLNSGIIAFYVPIERLHSRDYWPYWFTETKESICIKIEFNSQRPTWPPFTNMAVATSCENTLLAVLGSQGTVVK